MIVLDEEKIEKRLNKEDNLAIRLGKGNRVNHEDAGRNPGDNNLHPVLRSIISAAAQIDTAKNVAENFNISPGHAHNLKHGRVTPNGAIKDEILDGKENHLKEIRENAVDILLSSLHLTKEKLSQDKDKLKLSTLSSVSKDMASIIEKTSPHRRGESDSGVGRVVILTVPQKEISEYSVIEVNAKEVK
jgi:hypothetical protein